MSMTITRVLVSAGLQAGSTVCRSCVFFSWLLSILFVERETRSSVPSFVCPNHGKLTGARARTFDFGHPWTFSSGMGISA